MAKVTIGVLGKGDTVLFVNERFIAIQRKNGNVDLMPFFYEGNACAPRIDTKNITTITYGKNTVETNINGDNGELKITTF